MMDKAREARLAPVLERIPAAWGKWVDTPEGWDEVILDLTAAIAKLAPNFEIHQVKEKFGGLRYYVGELPSNKYDEIRKLIEEAELKAAALCEECSGEEGVTRETVGHWIRTLCNSCRIDILTERARQSQ